MANEKVRVRKYFPEEVVRTDWIGSCKHPKLYEDLECILDPVCSICGSSFLFSDDPIDLDIMEYEHPACLDPETAAEIAEYEKTL